MNLAILSAGMVTSVGFNARASCAAIQAGIRGISQTGLTVYIGSFEYVYGGKVELPQWWNSLARLADLVAPAIKEALSSIPEKEWSNIPLLLGVAMPDVEVLGDVFQGGLLAIIESKLALPHHHDSEIFAYGQTSGAHALIKAKKLLQSGSCKYCVIAGTDSYLQRATVDHYISQRRVMTQDNSNGFFPGEAGAATLVGLSEDFPAADVHILALGQGYEETPISSEAPFSAQGMTEALRQMQEKAGVPLSQIKTSLSDLNGEYYKFNEINLSTARFSSASNPVDISEVVHPIEFIGEVGAAILPCLLNLAYFRVKKPYSCDDKYILVHLSNNGTERVAITLKCN